MYFDDEEEIVCPECYDDDIEKIYALDYGDGEVKDGPFTYMCQYCGHTWDPEEEIYD